MQDINIMGDKGAGSRTMHMRTCAQAEVVTKDENRLKKEQKTLLSCNHIKLIPHETNVETKNVFDEQSSSF